ncbi:uncharacterized protein N7511_007402 [Penicillium nucicola]|uniref:uncharacterized protein n=1 Tax=Penicillium nucicola TaxID=1850975 RepID=UPI00254542C8|nr:uncharacterized protein N7511_007402 [Penicillium nucicola]KAJ5757220.1 hypothetical protein N7511_007402 [Penicillium nucicola]
MALMKIGALQKLAAVRRAGLQSTWRQRVGCALTAPARLPLTARLLSTTNSFKSTEAVETEDTQQSSVETEAQQNTSDLPKLVFEEHGDIRNYLSQWAAQNPLDMDPVRQLRSLRFMKPTIGAMPNNREASDVWGVQERRNENTDDEVFGNDHLEPGDLIVRLDSYGAFTYGIYVRSVHKQRQFYISNGNWRICKAIEFDYAIKGFAPPELLEPLIEWLPDSEAIPQTNIQTVPEGGLPRPVGAPLLTMMDNFKTHMVEFYRKNSHILDNLHELVADDTEVTCLTLEQLTINALDIEEAELNSINMFAIHQAVRRHPFLIERDNISVFSQNYLVQPKSVAKMVNQVVEWTHEHQEGLVRAVMGKEVPGIREKPMQQFLSKAQRLIRMSRNVRSPTIMSSVGPSAKKFKPGQPENPLVYREFATESFTANDQKILEFLQLYAVPSTVMPSGTLRSTATHIMRATGMYNTLGLSEASTRLFLQEIGVIAPWENLYPLDQYLMLPGHGGSISKELEQEELEETCANMTADQLQDSMQDLRKDWGDLPVFCVDDATAEEIDDGVSLERIPGSDDTFWVRVHVANPTAFLNHDDDIMRNAASRITSTYIPERSYPMLPKSLTQNHFSLQPDRPVLTISAKINLQGEILDTEIINGRIHNVITITHGTLSDYFNKGSKIPSETWTVGGEHTKPQLPKNKTVRDTLLPEDEEKFNILRQLMLALRQHRVKNGAIELTPLQARSSVSVQMGGPMKPYEMQSTTGRYYLGDPIISLGVHNIDPYEVRDVSKDNLISLIMNLAGSVTGQFLASRNIPAVFDGTWYDPEYERLTKENIFDFCGSHYYDLSPPSHLTKSTPIPHHTMGLDAYVKSTSPLRRYCDIIAHYQIEAALRFEHEHGRQFDALVEDPDSTEPAIPEQEPESANTETESDEPTSPVSTSTAILPFSKFALDAHLTYQAPIQARINQVDDFSKEHWTCMFLFRAFYFAECDLPETFPCVIRMPRTQLKHEDPAYGASITNLGLDCIVTVPASFPDKDELDVFSLVEARIISVDMATLRVTLEAVKFVRPFKRTGEWA